jgi:hypothetical protein
MSKTCTHKTIQIELPKEFTLEEITTLGITENIFRFQIQDNYFDNQVYFKKEYFNLNKEQCIIEIKKELDYRELVLVKIVRGIIAVGDQPQHMTPQAWYFIYAQKRPNPELYKIPF